MMMNDPKEKREILQSEARNKTAKIIAGLFPVGGAAYEVITTIVVPLHEKKKREFINDLAIRLKRLEEQGLVDYEELAQNEEFNTIITKAILLAQQNHQEEKLKALRAIAINSALNVNKPSKMFDWAVHFLHILDRISPMHILLLKTFRNPYSAVEKKQVDLSEKGLYRNDEIFFRLYPELKDRAALINQCWNELVSYGFIIDEHFGLGTGKSHSMHTDEKILPKSTDFGNKFLDMIESDE